MASALGDALAGFPAAEGTGLGEMTVVGAEEQAAAFFGGLQASVVEPVPLDFAAARSTVVACVQTFGFEVEPLSRTPGSAGILVGGIDTDRESAELSAAVMACQDSAVAAGLALSWDDPRSWDQRYEALLEVHECLLANGFESPSPPARAAFDAASA
ncbi:MAG: hypothetical protein JW785_02215 [Acidimicrobiia bacterium]|nr:hypothetical protein [Acidimicrobiia bacterium]